MTKNNEQKAHNVKEKFRTEYSIVRHNMKKFETIIWNKV
jgi:hypothetical protein